VTAQTPTFGIKYLVPGEPIRTTRQALEDNAKTIEAALLQRVNAPTVPDLNAEVTARQALAARVATLEGNGWTTVLTTLTGGTAGQNGTSSWTAIAGLSATVASIAAGRSADFELAIPSVHMAASSTLQIRLFDTTTSTVLDAAEFSTGTVANFAPARLSGSISNAAGSSAITGRTVQAQVFLSSGAVSSVNNAASGFMRLRYRIS
jgi:hypothetical protein